MSAPAANALLPLPVNIENGAADFVERRRIERIQPLGPVMGEYRNAGLTLYEEAVKGHGACGNDA